MASATGGLHPNASAPNRLPKNASRMDFFSSSSTHTARMKKKRLQISMQSAPVIAVQYSAGASTLYQMLMIENADASIRYMPSVIFLKNRFDII